MEYQYFSHDKLNFGENIPTFLNRSMSEVVASFVFRSPQHCTSAVAGGAELAKGRREPQMS